MVNPAESQAAAFNEVALLHLDALYRYAMSLTHNQAESEDLVQETYLRASGRLRADSNVKSWLFTILRNARLNQLQSPAFHSKNLHADRDLPADAAYTASASDNPHISYLTVMRAEDVRRAVQALPAAHREIIVLREFEELSYEDIAQILECRIGTVMSRLSRARKTLKQALQSWDERRDDLPSWTEPHKLPASSASPTAKESDHSAGSGEPSGRQPPEDYL